MWKITLQEKSIKKRLLKSPAARRTTNRMFSFITDISLTEYIRGRKLTLAAIELQSSDIKVIDLALKYGYDSPVSFSRANNPHEPWNQNHANGAYKKLAADAGDLPPFVSPGLCKVHGVCDYKQTEPGTFAYMQCAFKSKNSKVDRYDVAEFQHAPIIIGGKAMEYYGIRKAGVDIDMVITGGSLIICQNL